MENVIMLLSQLGLSNFPIVLTFFWEIVILYFGKQELL